MPDQNTKQYKEEDSNYNDPRTKFVTEVLAEVRDLLLHDPAKGPIHRIKISVDLEAANDEIHVGWGRTFL